MESNRFDSLAKGMAAPTTRRRALGALASGGLLGALGLRAAPHAAPAAAAGQTCTLAFAATARMGPSAGQLAPGATQPGVLQGQLSFGLTETGAIERGGLRLGDGTTLPAVGHATGRTLHLRIGGGDGGTLIVVGTGEREIAACQGAVDGMAAGPRRGDLGDWHATAQGLSGGPSASGAAAGGAATSTQAKPAAPTAPAPAPTAAPASTAAATADASGCEAGEVRCVGQYCADLNTDPYHCGACFHPCKQFEEVCEGGVCVPFQCPDGTTMCSTGGCYDLSTSTIHCGACDNACAEGQICQGGACQDAAAGPVVRDLCGGRCQAGEICLGGNCVQAPVVNRCAGIECPAGTVCQNGACVILNPIPADPVGQ